MSTIPGWTKPPRNNGLTSDHQYIMCLMVAAQTALLGHAAEDVEKESIAKPQLLKILAEITKLAKKLDD